MHHRHNAGRLLALLVAEAFAAGVLSADAVATPGVAARTAEEAASREAVGGGVVLAAATALDALPDQSVAVGHPLDPVLRLAQSGRRRIAAEVRDYTCRLFRRERHGGRLGRYEAIDVKVRHAAPATPGGAAVPLGIYLRFERPRAVAGREVLFVQGRHASRMLVRRGGPRLGYLTTFLLPTSPLAMRESRYPVTDIGFLRLLDRLTEVIRQDRRHGECLVEFFDGAKIGDRRCTRVVVEHPTPRDHFRYHRAVVFVDAERGLPLGYASYTWPDPPGGPPVLVEEYVYTRVRLNVGLTDADFDRNNPAYGFLRPEAPAGVD